MSSILVLQASKEINLSPITERLWQEHIPHRVILNKNSQDLWVSRVEDAEQVKIWVQEWKAGTLTAKPDAKEKTPWQVNIQRQLISASQFPFTAVLLFFIATVFALQQIGMINIGHWLLDPMYWSGLTFDWSSFWQNEAYRWVSPAFIHLSFMHILMNGFWWWILGKEIESRDGSLLLILLTLLLSIGSAYAQYLAIGPYFAGLSGVTYGLMGWVWARQTFNKNQYQLPSWLFPFMIVTMVMMMLVDSAGLELKIGHESHLAGAVLGVVFGYLLPRSSKFNITTPPPSK